MQLNLKNMQYGKIENGNLRKYQSIAYIDGGVTFNPNHNQWIENGYYPIIESRPAERDGFWISEKAELINEEIVIIYEFIAVEVQDAEY